MGGKGLIQTKEFTICSLVSQGDLSSLNVSEDRLTYSASVSEALAAEYLAPEEKEYTAAIRLYGEESYTEDEMENAIKELCLNIGCDEENINFNLKYLMTMLSTSTEMRTAVLLVSGLILFFSALVIYSIYYVSVITDVQEIGKLKALGASKKQVKRLLVSVTLGNLFGYLIFLYAEKKHLLGLSAYHYPVWETLFLAAVLVIGQLLITGLTGRRVHRESLIDRIRSGES